MAADIAVANKRRTIHPAWVRICHWVNAIAILVSVYVLWTFGRFESAALGVHAMQAIVLGFPSALGAAAARLII